MTSEDFHDRSVLSAGYVPLDIVSYQNRVWHAAGGTAGNVPAILAFLGWRASVVGELGADTAGQRVRRDLQRANVSVKWLRLNENMRTPRVVHEIGARGHRFLFKCPKCGQNLPHSRPLRVDRAIQVAERAETPDVFFFDRLNAGTIEMAERFADDGSFVVFEPSRPSRPDLLARAAKVAHLIKFAEDRKSRFIELSGSSPSQMCVITRGELGATYRIGEGQWHDSPAFPYPVVDAGGAGDWTTAGIVHVLSRTIDATSKELGDAVRWAQSLAAVSCGAPGARGLARQQTAETVIRAAQFLEREGEQFVVGDSRSRWRAGTAPAEACQTCLQDTRVEGLVESTG